KYSNFIGDIEVSPKNIINTYESSVSAINTLTLVHDKNLINGSLVIVKNNGGGSLVVDSGLGVTITGAPVGSLTLVGQGSSIILQASSVSPNTTNYRLISIMAKANQVDVNSGDSFKYVTSNRLFQSGSTGTRPSSPIIGFNRLNTTIGYPEW